MCLSLKSLILVLTLITLTKTSEFDMDIEALPIERTDQDEIVCRNGITGEPVDWFTIYKLPKKVERIFDTRKKSKVPFVGQGTAYVYMTDKEQEWKLSSVSLNDTLSMPGVTLDRLYTTDFSADPSFGYILYNDQADTVTVVKGHTKGVVLFNEKSAVWIVHSIPHFPPKASEKNYEIRQPQCLFGQSMLCMSFKFEELEKIGQQLLFTFPQIYDSFVPDNLRNLNSPVLANILNVLKGGHVREEPWSSVSLLTTAGGEKMLSFAKFSEFHDDLYSGLVAPNLKTTLLTETWSNGAGTLRSNCSTNTEYHVLNIESVRIEAANLKFSVHNDHSKWTVSDLTENLSHFIHAEYDDAENYEDQAGQIACIGDINRQKDQFKRAGGTVCFMNNQNVWEEYHKLVSDVEQCKKVKVNKFKIKKIQEDRDKLIMLG